MPLYALDRHLTAQVLGKARLLLDPADWAQIEEWIADASPESHASIARWDPDGEGYTVATVAFDLAHLAARAVRAVRETPGRSAGPLVTGFRANVGDWTVRFMVRQQAKRGDLRLHIAGAEPWHANPGLSFATAMLLAGIPVYVKGREGYVTATDLHRHFPWPEDI